MSDHRVRCSKCGKNVSDFEIPEDGIIRAWIECPECIEKELDQPKEEWKIDYLEAAKEHQRDVTSNNSRAVESATTCALIFIGEQLERIANAVEKSEANSSLDESVKIWGIPENDG